MKMASASPWPNVPATIMMPILSQESPSASMMNTGEWIIQKEQIHFRTNTFLNAYVIF